MLSAMERLADLTGRIEQAAFDADWVLQDAVMRELEALGEAAGRVSGNFTKAHPEIPWKEITGLRHKFTLNLHAAACLLQGIVDSEIPSEPFSG